MVFFEQCPYCVVSGVPILFQGQPFDVEARSLGFSVALYSICSILCIVTLVVRRYVPALGGCELGGPKAPKMVTGAFFCLLWFLYITLSALQAYDVIDGF